MFAILDNVPATTLTPSALADWLMARGQHFITTDEVARLVGVEPAVVSVSLQRAREAHKMVSVTKGAWVPVPPGYRAAGAPPPLHYIDPLMRHLGHPYYVGLLSAARLHGASHQVPMVLQVVTPALLRDRRIGRSRLEFVRRSATAHRPTVERTVPTVIGDLLLASAIDSDALADAAAHYPTVVAQRTGHLVEHMAGEVDAAVSLDHLERLIADAAHTVLDPQRPRNGRLDRRWRVITNTDIKHDL
jgi:predicted transcriptional regulator of viral defense system